MHKKNNGGYPEPNIYDINDDEGGAVFDCLLSFTNKDANIEVVYELTSLPKVLFHLQETHLGTYLF